MLTNNKKNTRSKGRLVRSLDFDPIVIKEKSGRKSNKNPSKSIWRDSRNNLIQPAGFTTHKMSSVTNNFLSSDLLGTSITMSSDSEIDEMVDDLVEPGKKTLVFPQHDEVFRTSPLSSSSFILADDDLNEECDFIVTNGSNENASVSHESQTVHHQHDPIGMTWNPKQNQWLPIVYRYIFPLTAFSLPKHNETRNTSSWTLKNGQVHFENNNNGPLVPRASFTFPPPQKSIMMGSPCDKINREARDVCEKLLELIDDENLMLPVVKNSPNSSSPLKRNPMTGKSMTLQTGKTLISEWSSLPSSPPPPIFHDVVCNRPIPELRLSPPMSGKSFGKRPVISTQTTNSPCESPLTKRLRFSSSSSSIASQ